MKYDHDEGPCIMSMRKVLEQVVLADKRKSVWLAIDSQRRLHETIDALFRKTLSPMLRDLCAELMLIPDAPDVLALVELLSMYPEQVIWLAFPELGRPLLCIDSPDEELDVHLTRAELSILAEIPSSSSSTFNLAEESRRSKNVISRKRLTALAGKAIACGDVRAANGLLYAAELARSGTIVIFNEITSVTLSPTFDPLA